MQLNEARFSANGKCGYVLKPAELRDSSFHPTKKQLNNPSLIIKIQVFVVFIFFVANFILVKLLKVA